MVRVRPQRDLPHPITLLGLGYDVPRGSDEEELQAAVTAAAEADVVVLVVGGHADTEAENIDRTTLALRGRQDELVEGVLAYAQGSRIGCRVYGAGRAAAALAMAACTALPPATLDSGALRVASEPATGYRWPACPSLCGAPVWGFPEPLRPQASAPRVDRGTCGFRQIQPQRSSPGRLGSRLTSADVVYSLTRQLDPNALAGSSFVWI